MKYCLDWAFHHASVAVDTMFRIDIQHFGPLVKTIAGANIYAGCVFAADAFLGDNVSHDSLSK